MSQPCLLPSREGSITVSVTVDCSPLPLKMHPHLLWDLLFIHPPWWMWRAKEDLKRCLNTGCKRERDEWQKDSNLHLAHPAFLDCSFILFFLSCMLFSWLGLGPSFVWCGNKASVTTGMGPLSKTAKGLWSVIINKTWMSLNFLSMKLCQDLHHVCASVRHAQTCDRLLYSCKYHP